MVRSLLMQRATQMLSSARAAPSKKRVRASRLPFQKTLISMRMVINGAVAAASRAYATHASLCPFQRTHIKTMARSTVGIAFEVSASRRIAANASPFPRTPI